MADPILLNPDNRLLGSSTGDFSLFGSQGDPRFSVHGARDEAPVSQAPDAAAINAAPPAPIGESAPASGAAPAIAAPSEGEAQSSAISLAPQSFLIAPQTADFSPVQGSLGEVASPVHSGWSPVAFDPGSPNPASAGAGSSSPASNGAVDGAPGATSLDAVTGAATALLNDLVEPAGSATSALSPITTTAEGLVDTPIETVQDALAAAPQDVVIGTAASLLDDLAEPAGLVTGAPPPLTGVADGLIAATGAVDDTLDGLGGSDPLGGVATLVNLVSVSDVFDFRPVDPPMPDAAGDPGLGILDALVGEDAPEPLLGVGQEDSGPLGHPLDDNPLGL
jgi:hypothetical protein